MRPLVPLELGGGLDDLGLGARDACAGHAAATWRGEDRATRALRRVRARLCIFLQCGLSHRRTSPCTTWSIYG
jgi:hypothetical protein